MIYYDSHKWRTLAKIRGSVLPKAMMWAMPSALFAFCLKWQENEGNIDLDMLDVLTQGDIYSGFTFVLGFSLVFRTSQSYIRYWTAATSVHEMGSEWSDSCASLIAFSTISTFPDSEILRFRHTVIRLFSILHAMALEEIASVDGEFPLLGVDGLPKEKLMLLTSGLAQGRKVQVVLSWIKAYITQMSECGLLNTPPPILTRVFQELGAGLVNYHKAQQIVIWPFPFPYTQLNLLLIQVYTVLTPLVCSTWKSWPWVCSLFTFISVTCMIGLDLIASELENPFGDDPNDLPVLEMQEDMNKILTLQLNPAIHSPPQLLPSANLDYRELAVKCQTDLDRTSLQQRLERSYTTAKMKATLSSGTRSDRLQAQLRWCGKASVEPEIKRLQNWLKCLPSQTREVVSEAVQREQHPEAINCDRYAGIPPDSAASSEIKFQDSAEASSVWNHERGLNRSTSDYSDASSAVPIQRKAQDFNALRKQFFSSSSELGSRSANSRRCTAESRAMETVVEQSGSHVQGGPPSEEHVCNGFLNALHEELKTHFENQLDMQRKELRELEGVLLRAAQALSPSRRPSQPGSPQSCGSAEGGFGTPSRWSKGLEEPEAAQPSPAPKPLPIKCSGSQGDIEEREQAASQPRTWAPAPMHYHKSRSDLQEPGAARLHINACPPIEEDRRVSM